MGYIIAALAVALVIFLIRLYVLSVTVLVEYMLRNGLQSPTEEELRRSLKEIRALRKEEKICKKIRKLKGKMVRQLEGLVNEDLSGEETTVEVEYRPEKPEK